MNKYNKIHIALAVISVVAYLIYFIVTIPIFIGAIFFYILYWPFLIVAMIVNLVNLTKNSKALVITSLVMYAIILITGFAFPINWVFVITGFILSIIALVKYQK